MERIVPPRRPRTWRDSLRAGLLWLALALLLAYVWASFAATGFSLSELTSGFGQANFKVIGRELASPDLSWVARDKDGNIRLDRRTGEPAPGTLQLLLRSMNMTVMIGLLGTLLSVVFSFLLAFPASRNLTRESPLGRISYVAARAVLNILRAIEPIILGIIFIFVVGPSPFAGILALGLH
nr:hypothetical protein [bacterium]